MATLSIRIPDRLKNDVSDVARHQGVSMNNYITSCLSAAVAQESARRFFAARLEGADPDRTCEAFHELISHARQGEAPSEAEIESRRNGPAPNNPRFSS